MLAIYLIGLREGLEATLVVTILVAFLVKSGLKERLRYVWLGVFAATAISVGFAAALSFTTAHLESQSHELFDAIASIAAVVFVTWMIFWMRWAARGISGDLRSKLNKAVAIGPLAIVVTAFLAVAREGLETALFFFATVQATNASGAVSAILAGLATSIAIGAGLYYSAVKINLTRFFTWTGVVLVLVAAGILKYGVHDLQESGVLSGLNNTMSFPSYDPTLWWAELLRGMFNITTTPTVLETLAWLIYAVPVLAIFIWPSRPATRSAHA